MLYLKKIIWKKKLITKVPNIMVQLTTLYIRQDEFTLDLIADKLENATTHHGFFFTYIIFIVLNISVVFEWFFNMFSVLHASPLLTLIKLLIYPFIFFGVIKLIESLFYLAAQLFEIIIDQVKSLWNSITYFPWAAINIGDMEPWNVPAKKISLKLTRNPVGIIIDNGSIIEIAVLWSITFWLFGITWLFKASNINHRYLDLLDSSNLTNNFLKDLGFFFSVDGISMIFIGLSLFIIPLCLLASIPIMKTMETPYLIIYIVCIFSLEYFIIGAFAATNFFFFFVFFEATLIPMIILIGIWGPTSRRIKANYYLVFYTLFGSILFLFAILILIVERGSADIYSLYSIGPVKNIKLQLFLWFCVSLSFSIKMPIFPFHIWLPEAHVEAPTVGSVILAALLLKLGGYGFIRFLPIFPYAYAYFMPLMYTLGCISIIYASLITIRQTDLKKIIAYSSVAHMNLCTIGIFSLNFQGIQGSIFLMLSHGIVSSALFLLIGLLYERYGTKILQHYGGLVSKMPVFTFFFFFFSLSNLAFPGTSNFIGELLILIGAVESNISIMLIAGSGMLFSSIYSIWLFNRLCFGTMRNTLNRNSSTGKDMTFSEIYYMAPLVFFTLLFGIFPTIILEFYFYPIKIWLQWAAINF